MSPPIVCFTNKGKSCSNLVCEVWWHRRAENESSCPVHEIVFQGLPTAYEGAGTSQCFSAGVNGGEDFVFTAVLDRNPPALRAKNPDCVSFIDHQFGIVIFRQPDQAGDRRYVPLHAE